MDHRHPVDQKKQISPSVIQQSGFSTEYRLFYDLIPALSRCDLQTVINFQADLFTKMYFILRIVTFYGYCFPVDKSVQL